MVSEGYTAMLRYSAMLVLILVLMEDGLGDRKYELFRVGSVVLILVLMEDGLGVSVSELVADENVVLILVLMEDGLGDIPPQVYDGWDVES